MRNAEPTEVAEEKSTPAPRGAGLNYSHTEHRTVQPFRSEAQQYTAVLPAVQYCSATEPPLHYFLSSTSAFRLEQKEKKYFHPLWLDPTSQRRQPGFLGSAPPDPPLASLYGFVYGCVWVCTCVRVYTHACAL